MKIYIDYDGPILNIKRKSWEVHSKIIQELGGKVIGDIDYYWAQKRDGIKRTDILEEYGITASLEPEYLKRYISIVETGPYLAFDSIVEGGIETLNNLIKRHQLVLVTLRKNIPATKRQLDKLQLTEFFTDIFIGGDKMYKSETRAKERMLGEDIKKTKQKGNLFVGDSNIEILAAKAWKIPSVVVLNGIRNENYLSKFNPTHMIKDINYLPLLLKKL